MFIYGILHVYFLGISQCCKSDAIIASNSMNLNINDIAERASHKEVSVCAKAY